MIRYNVTIRTNTNDDVKLEGYVDGIELVKALSAALPDGIIMLASIAPNQPDGAVEPGAVLPTGSITEKPMPDGSTIIISTGFEEAP